MVWFVQPMELKDDAGNPSGKWRLIARSDDGGGFWECTQKTFNSAIEAANDTESQAEADRITGMPDRDRLFSAEAESELKYKKVCAAANKLLSALNEFTHPGLSSVDLASAVSEDFSALEEALEAAGKLSKID